MAFKYTEEVLEHFRHPRNVGVVKNPDGVGKVTSPVCGDIMELYIKVKDNHIVDVKFQTFGCAAAVASSSVLTEMIKGKTVEEALKITNKRIAEALGGLPKEKVHCSVLAEDGVKSAIEDYLRKKQSGGKMQERIEKVLNEDIKPMLAMDGGSVELVEVKDGIVKVRLTGACSGCPMAQLTLTKVVEAKLKEKIPEVKRVQAV